jgi:hypothetical protein
MRALDLSKLSRPQLHDEFLGGSCPGSLRDIDGISDGTILTMMAASGRMPGWGLLHRTTKGWLGKWFESEADDRGSGLNRVLVKEAEELILAFKTSIEPSRLDGKPCVVLDYDQGSNVRVIRGMRDELRLISPGVMLGRAYMRFAFRLRPISWFALEEPS